MEVYSIGIDKAQQIAQDARILINIIPDIAIQISNSIFVNLTSVDYRWTD